jgi:hypothetical protein
MISNSASRLSAQEEFEGKMERTRVSRKSTVGATSDDLYIKNINLGVYICIHVYCYR